MNHTIDNKSTKLFISLGGFFIANALIAEFIGVKIFQLESSLGLALFTFQLFGEDVSLTYTAGVLLWPVVFIITDVINEYFGKKGVKFLSYLAVILIIYAFIMIYAAIALVPAKWWTTNYINNGVPDMQKAFESVFGQGLLIIIGSLIAFLVGQIIDVTVFHKIKAITGEKKIWARATGSTLVSQFIDSFVVLFIAFYIGPRLFPGNGTPWSLALFIAISLNNYIYKFIIAIILTPVIYMAHHFIDKYLGKEAAHRMKENAKKQ